MKILVVSLLRVGDVLLVLPTLESLRRAHPEAELHLLCNESASGLQSLLPHIHFHIFERTEIQQGLGEYQRPFFDSFFQLKELLTELNELKFDRVINLTQNRLSGWLCAAINSPDKSGLVMNRNGSASFGSSWFSYLNDYVAGGGKEIFHYSDIYAYGSGVAPSNEVSLTESPEGQAEASKILKPNAGFAVLVQSLTSEKKKTWSAAQWIETMRLLQTKYPNATFYLLGAPTEEPALRAIATEAFAKGVKIELAICSLAGAYSLLRRADLLLTGDTSIKHLASATGCPVVELSIGSSDFRKTGVYRKGNLIIQAKVTCAPCSHLVPCDKPTHECGEQLAPSAVALAVSGFIAKDFRAIKVVAEEFESDLEIFRTQFSDSRYWMAEPMSASHAKMALRRLIEKSTWKLMLEREHRKSLGEFGSEGRRLAQMLRQGPFALEASALKDSLRQLEREARLTESAVTALMSKGRLLGSSQQAAEALRDLTTLLHDECERDDSSRVLLSVLASYKVARPGEPPDLNRLRKIIQVLEEVKDKSAIRMKLIRSMQSQAMERS